MGSLAGGEGVAAGRRNGARHVPLCRWTGSVMRELVLALELLHSARNPAEFAVVEDGLRGLPWVEMGEACWARAREVYRALGSRPGMMQRKVKHPDLLIAAAAERAGITLVHYDADYDTIAEITGQPVRWAAPRGSL